MAARAAQHEEQKQQALSQWEERLTPLEKRLKKLLPGIPEKVIAQGLSLNSLRRLLVGKWRRDCHPGELGAALRQLGYVRRRGWSGAEGGERGGLDLPNLRVWNNRKKRIQG